MAEEEAVALEKQGWEALSSSERRRIADREPGAGGSDERIRLAWVATLCEGCR